MAGYLVSHFLHGSPTQTSHLDRAKQLMSTAYFLVLFFPKLLLGKSLISAIQPWELWVSIVLLSDIEGKWQVSSHKGQAPILTNISHFKNKCLAISAILLVKKNPFSHWITFVPLMIFVRVSSWTQFCFTDQIIHFLPISYCLNYSSLGLFKVK